MLATVLVLVAAVLHAIWNTLIKFSGERLLVIACMDTVALVVVAVGVTAAWFMQSSSEQPVSSPELALQQPADMPLGRPASSEGAAPAVEFATA